MPVDVTLSPCADRTRSISERSGVASEYAALGYSYFGCSTLTFVSLVPRFGRPHRFNRYYYGYLEITLCFFHSAQRWRAFTLHGSSLASSAESACSKLQHVARTLLSTQLVSIHELLVLVPLRFPARYV